MIPLTLCERRLPREKRTQEKLHLEGKKEKGHNPQGRSTPCPVKTANGTCACLQLSLLHSSCLTCFYPPRISDSEQKSLFKCFTCQSLMPARCSCSRLKRSPSSLSPQSQTDAFSLHINKKAPSDTAAESFVLQVT